MPGSRGKSVSGAAGRVKAPHGPIYLCDFVELIERCEVLFCLLSAAVKGSSVWGVARVPEGVAGGEAAGVRLEGSLGSSSQVS